MDETPEQMEQLRRDAAAIDPYRYKKRGRILGAVALGMAGAGLAWLLLEMKDSTRNPCQRVRDHFCAQDPTSNSCTAFSVTFKESVEYDSPKMRSMLLQQCGTKIRRLKEEEGVIVK